MTISECSAKPGPVHSDAPCASHTMALYRMSTWTGGDDMGSNAKEDTGHTARGARK